MVDRLRRHERRVVSTTFGSIAPSIPTCLCFDGLTSRVLVFVTERDLEREIDRCLARPCEPSLRVLGLAQACLRPGLGSVWSSLGTGKTLVIPDGPYGTSFCGASQR